MTKKDPVVRIVSAVVKLTFIKKKNIDSQFVLYISRAKIYINVLNSKKRIK